jgi:hypothetical protein
VLATLATCTVEMTGGRPASGGRSEKSRFTAVDAVVGVAGVSTPPSSSAQLKLVATSDALPSSDQRWRNQVETLLADLRRNGGEVRKEITPVAGAKGGAESILLALGSSGAIAAAVTVFRAWLARSADRSIEIEGTIDGREVKLKLNGRNIDETTIRQALRLAGG